MIVADSPFSNLEELCIESINQETYIPKFLIKLMMNFVSDSVWEKAEFEI